MERTRHLEWRNPRISARGFITWESFSWYEQKQENGTTQTLTNSHKSDFIHFPRWVLQEGESPFIIGELGLKRIRDKKIDLILLINS